MKHASKLAAIIMICCFIATPLWANQQSDRPPSDEDSKKADDCLNVNIKSIRSF